MYVYPIPYISFPHILALLAEAMRHVTQPSANFKPGNFKIPSGSNPAEVALALANALRNSLALGLGMFICSLNEN